MYYLRKSFNLLICFVLCLSFFFNMGCGNKSTDEIPETDVPPATDQKEVVKGLPDYSAYKEDYVFRIGGYVAPPGSNTPYAENFNNQQQYDYIAQCDLDYVVDIYHHGNCEDNVKALEYAEKSGVEVIIRWEELANYYWAGSDELIRQSIGNLLEKDSCMGILVKDEPNASMFDKLAKSLPYFRKVTDKCFYVNLFPNYATEQQTGKKLYKDYINSYCAKTGNNMISVDHYPFIQSGKKYSLNKLYLSNLEVVAKYAEYYKMEHWEYVQGMKINSGSKAPDYNDLRFQIYTEMCYGVVNSQYFCYFTPDNWKWSGLIDLDGNRTDLYYDAQKLNREIHEFDHVYMNFVNNRSGVAAVAGSNNKSGSNQAFDLLKETIPLNERIKDYTSTEDSLVAMYKDKDGRDGFMIVNYTVPAYKTNNTVDISFNDTDDVIYYRDGKYNIESVTDGKFSITLNGGEGIFVIPVKY